MISYPDPDSLGGSRSSESEVAQRLLEALREELGAHDFEMWYREVECQFRPPETLIFLVQSKFHKTVITREHEDRIERCARNVGLSSPSIIVEVARTSRSRATSEPGGKRAGTSPRAHGRPELPPSHRHRSGATDRRAAASSPPSVQFSFDAFVVGACNRLAHAAALTVTERPGGTYNPLFLHGPTGTGKSHLLQAIGDQFGSQWRLDALVVSAATFVEDFGRAHGEHNLRAFRKKYRTVDALLVDDLQFLSGKAKTLEELSITCSLLLGEGRQVVIAASCPPQQIEGFQGRGVSLFRSALIAPLDSPDPETRLSFLLHQARHQGYDPTPEALEVLAHGTPGSFRELKGILTQAIGLARYHGTPLRPELARLALTHIQGQDLPPASRVTVDSILAAVGDHYQLKEREILSASKQRSLVFARQVGMYLARQLTSLSLQQIGSRFGGRDHSTVLYAQSCIEKRLRKSPQLQVDLDRLKDRLCRNG